MSDGDHECGKKVFTEVKLESSFPVDFYILGRFRGFFATTPTEIVPWWPFKRMQA